MSFKPTPHPVLGLPTPAQAMAMGERAWQEAMARRESIIRGEAADPFGQCWAPPIWRVVDAIMGLPTVNGQWAERMRKHLGFEKPAPVTLVNGGNRAGKSQWAAHRSMFVLRSKGGARAWALHSTLAMSRQYQQPLFYQYLPANLKEKEIKSRITYIAYKQKTGFSEEQFVLPPADGARAGSDCVFKAYEQPRNNIEGGNLDIVWPDELVPADWVETLEFRIAEKGGWMPITFTPVDGYTETVKMFQDGAEVVKESVAFLIPRDGGPADPGRALGFDDDGQGSVEEKVAELWAAAKHREEGKLKPRAALFPQAIPENCDAWLDGKSGQPAIPPGREFETVPRIMRCVSEEGKRAVVFFHSADNPYGNPKEVWALLAGKTPDFIKERFYGVALKRMTAQFPKFNLTVHGVDPEDVPKEGTNYHLVDPCSGRNFFMLWIRVTPEHAYVYREWPGDYYIDGIGVPGPWALPDGKKMDGRQGPAQKTFGFGYRDYKRVMAELEGWKDGENGEIGKLKAESQELPPEGGAPESKPIDEWDENNGAKEMVQERIIDARFASAPKLERDRPTTMITDFEEILVFFRPARGDDIAHGVQKINDLLNYDTEKPVDFFNKPFLLVSRACKNLIYALTTWTGQDGQKGATKDPIETLYRFATDDCPYLGGTIEEEEEEEERRYY